MECLQNLLLGDPVYDERGQLVRREFGLKNALALFVLGYIAYTLYCSMGKKVFSGKRKGRKGKMKGGGDTDGESDDGSDRESSKGKSGESSKGKSKVKKFIAGLTIIAGVSFIFLCVLILIVIFGDNLTFVKGDVFQTLLAVSGSGVAVPLLILILGGIFKGPW